MGKRVGGVIFIKADGIQFDAKGDFTYNLGGVKRTEVMGADKHHGFTGTPIPAKIEGAITDNADLDIKNDILAIENATITLQLYNGKTFVLEGGYFAEEGDITTQEGEMAVKFIGENGYEIPA